MIQDYNLSLVTVTVGDLEVTGFGESDAVTLAPMSDMSESVASADGKHVAVSSINDPRWECTITLQRGTSAFKTMMEFASEQKGSGAVDALPFQIYDPISGTQINEANLRFTRLPDLVFGAKAGEAEFKILLPSPKIIAAANVS